MNKVIKFLLVYVSFLLQSLVFSDVKILSVSPDLLVITIILTAIFSDSTLALILGAFGGLLEDVMCGNFFGESLITYAYVALICALLVDKKNLNSPVIMAWISFVCTTLYVVFKGVFYAFFSKGMLISYIGKSILVNGVFSIVVAFVSVLITEKIKERRTVKQ